MPRLDPLGDAGRYILTYLPLRSRDPSIDNALSFFHVDGNLLLTQLSALTPIQPLAWNENLAAASRQHNLAMIAADAQEHVLPGEAGLAARIVAAGYANGTTFAENIFAFAQSALHAHAGFMVDWGGGPGGMQTPPGHRNNIMNPNFREVGIGIVPEGNPATAVGPLVITQDFGARSGTGAFILGSAYNDTDQDNFYSAGEGLGSLAVAVAGATVTSWLSGGFALNTAATGVQTITFSGAGLPFAASAAISLLPSSNVLFHVVNGNTLETSTSATVGGSVTIVKGLGTVGLVLSAGDNIGRTIIGTRGSDSIHGAGGNDILNGGAGADILDGGGGADVLSGALGFDTVDYGLDAAAGGGLAVSVDLLSGIARDGFGSFDTLIGIEGVSGTAAGDIMYGSNGNEVLSGGGGDDQIVAWDAADYLNGGAGNDVILGWTGADTMFGADGNDWLWAGDGNDVADGGAGNDVLVGDLPGSSESGNDNLTGGLGGDILFGGSGDDILIGGLDQSDGSDPGATDWLVGGAGSDTLIGNSGDDVIWEQLDPAEGGNDTSIGGDGNDLILTGLGADIIVAGGGDDQIYGGPGLDQITTGPGNDLIWYTGVADAGDTVVDFTPGQDKAILYPVLLGQLTTAQAFAAGFLSIGAFGADTLLMFDSDGSAGPGAQIMLADFLAHSPADFDLVRDFA